MLRIFLKPQSTSALPSCRPDVISAMLASLSARSFPLTPACPGQKIHRSLCSQRLCMAVCQSGQPIPDSTFCRRFTESVRMMACVICVSSWEASHYIASHCMTDKQDDDDDTDQIPFKGLNLYCLSQDNLIFISAVICFSLHRSTGHAWCNG